MSSTGKARSIRDRLEDIPLGHWIGGSLKLKAILPIGLILVIMGSFALWLNARGVADRQTEALRGGAEMAATLQADALASPLWQFETDQVQRLLDALANTPGFQQARVIDPDGSTSASAGTPPDEGMESIRIERPIEHDQSDTPLATLELVISLEQLQQRIRSLNRVGFLVFMLVLGLILGGIYLVITFLVQQPLGRLRDLMETVSLSGDFSHRADVRSHDEIGQIAQSFNGLLDSTKSALDQTNTTVAGLAAGDFSHRVSISADGDLGRLRDGINCSAEQIQTTMGALREAGEALADADFSREFSIQAQGDFQATAEAVLAGRAAIARAITEVSDVLAGVADGEFTRRVEATLPGELNRMRDNTNRSLEALEGAIREIIQTARSMAAGDLTARISGQYHGDLDTLSKSLNQALQGLADLVESVQHAAVDVEKGAGDIARGNEALSERAEQQAANLEQTAASMEQIAGTIQETSQNARQASEVAAEAESRAEEGGRSVNSAIDSMEAINDSSERIGAIIKLIDDIAFQTNLLALNAAVEAARAGDQGRGFAVVASEVRTLAQRSTESAREIRDIIEDSNQKVAVGRDQVHRSGELLKEIIASIKSVSGLAREIAGASQEQSSGVEQVNQAISQLDLLNQQNTERIERMVHASRQLNDEAQQLGESAARFKLK